MLIAADTIATTYAKQSWFGVRRVSQMVPFPARFGFFLLRKGQNDIMSSDPSASPEKRAPTTASSDQVAPAGAAAPTQESVVFTRAAALWSALAVGMLILIVLLIFITQNTKSADLAFLGWHWSLPLGVAILLAAVSGGLITVTAGTLRIYQLRRVAKRHAAARQ